MPSRLSQQIVSTVLIQAGLRSNAEERHGAAVNVDADLTTLRDALVSSQSILSLIYHRERSKLSEQTRADLFETLSEVERVEKTIRTG